MKNKKSKWIMDCEKPIIKETLIKFLSMIDDLQQEHPGNQELESLYNELDVYYHNINDSDPVSLKDRNSIRMTCKHLIKITPFLN